MATEVHPVGTFKTGNTEWTVRVQYKRFYATAPGFTEVSGETWDEMEERAKVQASKAKVRVSVPYVFVKLRGIGDNRGPMFEHRTATGIHAGNGNVTFSSSSGSGQEDRHGFGSYMKPFSREDADAYLDLLRRKSELEKQIDDMAEPYLFKNRSGHKVSLKSVVQDAIDAEHARRAAGDGDSDVTVTS